ACGRQAAHTRQSARSLYLTGSSSHHIALRAREWTNGPAEPLTYLLDDTPQNRKLVHRYIEVWEYPDGRIELRADARVLPYREYDRLTEVDQGAVIEHKRLTHALQVAQALQAQRDGRRASGSPSRTNRGIEVRRAERVPGTKKSREFTQADMDAAIVAVTQRKTQTIQSGKPGKRSATVR
ncbi:hypothetical protein AB4Y42_35910, partial [Paraburkholderia sp. EG286B]